MAWSGPASALSTFWAVTEDLDPYANYPTPVGRHALVRVDFNTGQISEIGELGVAATSLAKEPGTGRLISWAGGATPGFYELNQTTGAASLLTPTAPGLDFFDISFASDGTLFGARYNGPANNAPPELHTIDLTLGTSTFEAATLPCFCGIEGNILNFALAPSGFELYSNVLSRTGLPNGTYAPWGLSAGQSAIAADSDGIIYWAGVDHLAAPWTVTLGSTTMTYNSGRNRLSSTDPSYATDSTNQFLPIAPREFHGLALVPEPGSGFLVALGLGFLIRASRRPRD